MASPPHRAQDGGDARCPLSERIRPPGSVVVGMGLISAGLMLLEISLTRVFSVTMWYHFAFMAISIAMLGLSAGAVLVHRAGERLGEARLHGALHILCLGCASLAVGGIAVGLRLRCEQTLTIRGVIQLGAIYLLTTLPFVAGGAAMATIVRRYATGMSTLYFGDLVGAALGCVLAIPLLRVLKGPPVVFATALLVSLGGAAATRRRLPLVGAGLVALLWTTNDATGLLRVVWAKQQRERGLLHEAWNSYSRITVFPTEEAWNTQFFAWGMSPTYDGPVPRQLGMHIDAYAGTPITAYSGKPEDLAHLGYDVTALVYHLRPHGLHLVIGPGGGRDILAALSLGADSVVAVEMNREVVTAVNKVFGSFSGRPYSLPRVETLVTEARSQLRRENRLFTVIQASLVDTWAATAAGAYTLTENTLYTVEAMMDYLAHLEPEGLVAISRFFSEPPAEALRLMAVALEALARTGSPRPHDHVAMVSCRNIATMIVGHNPLSPDDREAIKDLARRLGFSLVSLPGERHHPLFDELAARFRDPEFYRAYLFDVRPSTDDRPFFFNMVKPADFMKVFKLNDLPMQTQNHDAVFILVSVLVISVLMTGAFIIWPLRGIARKGGGRGASFGAFFACIGLAFMLAEVALLQRFVLFLGHPVYALSVVLLGLLLSGSVGSVATSLVPRGKEGRWALSAGCALALLIVAARVGLDVPLGRWLGAPKAARILLTLLLLLPLGFLMGTMLPLGMRQAAAWRQEVSPWLWGVNGASSVLGSVLAFVLAMNVGFKFTLTTAAVVYAAAATVAGLTMRPPAGLDRQRRLA